MSEVPLYATFARQRLGTAVLIRCWQASSSSLLLSSLELSDTKDMRLKYEPVSEPLHISVK